ncbi:MAG: hypothetical protein ACE15F_16850 [bacterium]
MAKRTWKLHEYDWQTFWLTTLRVVIGWHFLFEGLIKMAHPAWSSQGYLVNSWGPLAPLFQGMAALQVKDTFLLNWILPASLSQTCWILRLTDFFIPWALVLAGGGLMAGLFTTLAAWLAIGLLALFIAAAPPLDLLPRGVETDWTVFYADLSYAQWAGRSMMGSEGNYYLVNKNLVELMALAALLTMNGSKLYGLDNVFAPVGEKDAPALAPEEPQPASPAFGATADGRTG